VNGVKLADIYCFYRAMHFSAKRGLAIACRPSVRLKRWWIVITCWKSRKLIAQTIRPTSSLFAAKRRSTSYQGNMGKFWGDYRCGREKVTCWRTKAAISLKRVKIDEKLLWTAYINLPTLFRTVPSATRYMASPSSRLGFATLLPPLISGTGKATDFKFGGYIYRANPNKSPL